MLIGTVVWTSPAPWMRALDGKPIDIDESDSGERKSIYEGTINGDQMKGVVKFCGIGQKWEFDAQRTD